MERIKGEMSRDIPTTASMYGNAMAACRRERLKNGRKFTTMIVTDIGVLFRVGL